MSKSNTVITFNNVERQCPPAATVEELLSHIAQVFPCLSAYTSVLSLHYVDDEGDDIVVTTNEELTEAYSIGARDGRLFVKVVCPNVTPMPAATLAASSDITSRSPSGIKTLESSSNPEEDEHNTVVSAGQDDVQQEKAPDSLAKTEVPDATAVAHIALSTTATAAGSAESIAAITRNVVSGDPIDALHQAQQEAASQINNVVEIAAREIKRLQGAVAAGLVQLHRAQKDLASARAETQRVRAEQQELRAAVDLETTALKTRVATLEADALKASDAVAKLAALRAGLVALSNGTSV